MVPALVAGAATSAVGGLTNQIGNAIGGGNATPQQAPLMVPSSVAQANHTYNQSMGAIQQQQDLANQLHGGVDRQNKVYGQQQQLAAQLGQMAQGQGPNPAMAQLANSTGANVANQAALMAGQRGAGANAGLIARQAGQQGGALQQQAAGQGAALQAQQQLNAVGALQQQQGMLQNLASGQIGQQANALGNLNQFAQGEQAQVLGSIANLNNTAAGQQANVNDIQAQQALQNSKQTQGNMQGLSSGLGSSIAGGFTKMFAEGGQVGSQANLKENYSGSGPRSKAGLHLHNYAKGGKIHNMKQGGHVPGKAKVAGAVDSYANDTVDAVLSPGEVVIPRSVMKSKDPVKASAKFVAAIMSKKRK